MYETFSLFRHEVTIYWGFKKCVILCFFTLLFLDLTWLNCQNLEMIPYIDDQMHVENHMHTVIDIFISKKYI